MFTFAGYILGFPGDTKESILRDIEIIKRELPVDILEFFFLTPLPGSEDHQEAARGGRSGWIPTSTNTISTTASRTIRHDVRRGVGGGLSAPPGTPISPGSIWRRWPGATRGCQGGRPKKALQYLIEFKMLYDNEGVHTLEGGVRPPQAPPVAPAELPLEPALLFYPKFALESAAQGLALLARLPQGEGAAEADRRAIRRARIIPTSPPARSATTSSRRSTCSTRPRGGEEAVAKEHRQDALLESVRAAHAGGIGLAERRCAFAGGYACQ